MAGSDTALALCGVSYTAGLALAVQLNYKNVPQCSVCTGFVYRRFSGERLWNMRFIGGN